MQPEGKDRRGDDELGRLFAALRKQQDAVGDGGEDAAWDLAAGADEGTEPPRDRRQWLELGTADAVLAARGGSADAAARASAARVLARVHGAAASGARAPGRRWWLGGLAAVAATALVAALLQSSPPGFVWCPEDVAARGSRGGAPAGLDFRVRLRPTEPVVPAVFAVGWSDAGRDLQRLHPPIAAVLATDDYASWPRNPLAAGADVLLPPPSMSAPFALAAASGFVLVVTRAPDLDEAAVAAVQARLLATLPAATGGEPAIRAAVAALEADGLTVAWAPLELR